MDSTTFRCLLLLLGCIQIQGIVGIGSKNSPSLSSSLSLSAGLLSLIIEGDRASVSVVAVAIGENPYNPLLQEVSVGGEVVIVTEIVWFGRHGPVLTLDNKATKICGGGGRRWR